jgi:hypothetical protein
MKRLLIISACVVCFAAASMGQDSGFGIGAIVGDPTGISLKKWLSESRAIDGAVAWSLDDDEELQLHVDYLFHYGNLLSDDPHASSSGRMPVYYGIGGAVKFIEDDEDNKGNDDEDDEFIGIRVPFGVDYLLKNHPLDFFIEFVPVLQLVDETDLDLDAAFGLRYWFR